MADDGEEEQQECALLVSVSVRAGVADGSRQESSLEAGERRSRFWEGRGQAQAPGGVNTPRTGAACAPSRLIWYTIIDRLLVCNVWRRERA